MQFELNEMDFGTILDRGIKLFKSNFIPMVILMAIFFGPFAFASNLGLAMLQETVTSSNAFTNFMDSMTGNTDDTEFTGAVEDFLDNPEGKSTVGMIFASIFFMMLLTPFVYLGIYRILSEHILGRVPPIGEVIRFAAGKFWTLIGAMIIGHIIISVSAFILSMVIFGIGMAAPLLMVFISVFVGFFFIIGIFALLIFNILLPCVVSIEDVGSMEALKRTWWLLKGFWWRTFGIYLLASLLVAIITQIFLSVGQGIGGMIPGMAGNAFIATVSTLFTLIFQPFTLTIIFLLYIDIRIRKENFDMDILASHSFNTELNETVPIQTNNDDTWE